MKRIFLGIIYLSIILISDIGFTYPIADSFRFPLAHYEVGDNDFGSSIVYDPPIRHLGEDVKAKATDKIYATANGKIVYSGNVGGYGGVVLIEHNTGTEFVVSLVGHLNAETLTKTAGQEVSKDELLGEVGTSEQNGGWSEHLHFAIRKGKYISGSYYYYYNINKKVWQWTWAYLGYSKNANLQAKKTPDDQPNYDVTHESMLNDWYDPSDFIQSHQCSDTPQNLSLVRIEGQGAVYWLQNGKAYHVLNNQIIQDMAGLPGWGHTCDYPLDTLIIIPPDDPDPPEGSFEQGPDFITTAPESNGLLIKLPDDPKVYRIENGERRWISTEAVFNELGYDWDDIIVVTQAILDLIPEGDPITSTTPIHTAISKGLQYLRDHQNQTNGSWDDSVGITALATLAFLNNGVPETDPDVSEAIQYILDQRNDTDGSITNGYYPNYDTSIAILPLVATHNAQYLDEIAAAKDRLVYVQQDEKAGATPADWYYGGWGYYGHQKVWAHGWFDIWEQWADLSNTQWVLMGLDASYSALGLTKDSEDWPGKAIQFLEKCQNTDGGLTYNSIGVGPMWTIESYASMTYAGIWSYLLSGVKPGDPPILNALNWIKNNYSVAENPPFGDFALYYYYLSMAKALTMAGINNVVDSNGVSHDWFQELSAKLISLQQQDDQNPNAGYWVNPNSREWEDNKNLVTAYALLALETKTLPADADLYMSIVLASHCDLHVYDPQGRHIGLNYDTGQMENEIPGATFEWIGDAQQVTLPNLTAGEYHVELVGTSTGPYELTINGYQNNNLVTSEVHAGNISPGITHSASATVSAIEGALTVFVDPPAALPLISLDPQDLTLTFKPGEAQTYTFTISEIGGDAAVNGITVYAEDFVDGAGHTQPGNITSFDPNSFNLPAGSSQTVAMTVQWPDNTEFYPYTGSIIVESLNAITKNIELIVEEETVSIPGDLNGDGVLDQADINVFISQFGTTVDPAGTPPDYDGDGMVGLADYSILCSYF